MLILFGASFSAVFVEESYDSDRCCCYGIDVWYAEVDGE